jgi:hypothetical protein
LRAPEYTPRRASPHEGSAMLPTLQPLDLRTLGVAVALVVIAWLLDRINRNRRRW